MVQIVILVWQSVEIESMFSFGVNGDEKQVCF